MENKNWPKILPPLTADQINISNDFMKHWHELLAKSKRFKHIEKFNHGYPVKHSAGNFLTTLEIGAGLGEHLKYECLTTEQKLNYVALELRENMGEEIKKNFPEVQLCIADCQEHLPFDDQHFDRIIAIHVLEHLPNLPAAIKEIHRVCNKKHGQFLVVIPCEGGAVYSLARKISSQRIFEKRYSQPYKWFIEREHINKANEIIEELVPYFTLSNKQYFPFLLPSVNLNLCIGLTLKAKNI